MQLTITHTGGLRPVHIDPETLDCEEGWRVNRYLTDSQIEYLLDCAAQVEEVGEQSELFAEAGMYPDDGFMDDVIGNMECLLEELPLDLSEKMQIQINELRDLQETIEKRSALGRQALDKITILFEV